MGTIVQDLYEKLLLTGTYSKKEAAKEAQKQTGLSLISGRQPKTKITIRKKYVAA